MARQSYKGFEIVHNQLAQLERGTIKRMMEAGVKTLINETKQTIHERHHVVNRSMVDNVKPGIYHESLDGAWQTVYPQGADSRGVSNAMKAFVTNYGRKNAKRAGRKNRKSGDKFITGAGYRRKRESAVRKAMQAESDKIIKEIGGK